MEDVELLLEKYMQARRGKWMLEPICKNATDKIVDFLIETAIDDFHEFPDRAENSTVAIIENLGLSGKKSVAIFLNSILQKADLKHYHAAARRGEENFAAVTRFEIEDIPDLSVPDLEMSDNAQKIFEYEGSIITVSVSNSMKVVIKNELGEVFEKFDFLSSRMLSKYIADLGESLELLSQRFSDAIVTNRRWKFEAFEQTVLSHPIMKKFAENLLLAEYNDYNKPKRIFYFFMGGFLDVAGERVELNPDSKIGIINSLDIEERTRQELAAKFPVCLNQLGRGVCLVSEFEKDVTAVTRFNNYLIDYATFADALAAKGYTEGVRENKNFGTLYRINQKLRLAAKIIFVEQQGSRLIKNTRIPKVMFYDIDAVKKKNDKYSADRIAPLMLQNVDKYFLSDVLNDIYELIL